MNAKQLIDESDGAMGHMWDMSAATQTQAIINSNFCSSSEKCPVCSKTFCCCECGADLYEKVYNGDSYLTVWSDLSLPERDLKAGEILCNDENNQNWGKVIGIWKNDIPFMY